MTNKEKAQKAIEIFKAKLPEVEGRFRAHISDNPNEVEIFSEDGLYCTVNIRTGQIKGL